MEQEKANRGKRKVGYRNYTKFLIIVCLAVLAIFLAPWIWIIVGLWVFLWIAKKFRK